MQFDFTEIILIIFLIILNAFFAGSEIAVISARRVVIEQLKEEGNKSAAILLKLIDDPSFFLATIQVGITLAGFLASATAAVGLSQPFADFLQSLGLPAGLSGSLGVFIITLVISYLTLVFGELAPKRLALQWSEKISLLVARPINLIARITSPITKFLTLSTNTVVRLLGGNPKNSEKEISEEEIRTYIAEHRTLPIEEKRMIEGVFNFGDQVVRQVMTPRTELIYLQANIKIKDAFEKICNTGYEFFPVFEKDYDDIVGFVKFHNLACNVLAKSDKPVKEIMEPAFFIPETKSTVKLLKELRYQGMEIAIVVDEYGGTVGLITLSDLADEIIGEVIEDTRIKKISGGEWEIPGDTPFYEIVDALSLKKISKNPEYETVAGFLLEKLGHLPKEGESITWEGYTFRVKEMAARRINKIEILWKDKKDKINIKEEILCPPKNNKEKQ